MNKRMKRATYVSHFEGMFTCPLCHSSMKVIELKSLICSNRHTFDFTKQGAINLTTRHVKTKYSKDLFEARRNLIVQNRFFEPLSEAIAHMVNHYVVGENETLSIIDMGCGEGSHLVNICAQVQSISVVGVGVDLSKEGIFVAAKHYSDKIWVVADLTNTPFKNEQFDVILNILSPANYMEFKRLLKADGVVVKVVPQSGYLQELRETFFDEHEKQSYSNDDTVERFGDYFQVVDRSRLQYTVTLRQQSIQSLVQMTPLSWSAKEERLKSFLEEDSAKITVDLDLLVGKKQL